MNWKGPLNENSKLWNEFASFPQLHLDDLDIRGCQNSLYVRYATATESKPPTDVTNLFVALLKHNTNVKRVLVDLTPSKHTFNSNICNAFGHDGSLESMMVLDSELYVPIRRIFCFLLSI